MIDTFSAIAQILSLALSLGALVLFARTQRAKTRRSEKQPVPIRVERDLRQR
jgi:hypothetical protein